MQSDMLGSRYCKGQGDFLCGQGIKKHCCDGYGRGDMHGRGDCDGYGMGLCHGSLLAPLEYYVSDLDIRDNRGHGFADGYGTDDGRGIG